MIFEAISDYKRSRISVWISLLMFLFLPLFIGYVVLSKPMDSEAKAAAMAVVMICVAMGVIWCIAFFPRQYELCYATLTVTHSEIVFRCAPRREIRLSIAECAFLGVELPNFINKESYPFVYFSTDPLPPKYVNKIDKAKNTKTFIRFWYTDELAKTLISIFPDNKTSEVRSYYEMRRATWRKGR